MLELSVRNGGTGSRMAQGCRSAQPSQRLAPAAFRVRAVRRSCSGHDRSVHGRPRASGCSVPGTAAVAAANSGEALLDAYWRSRGVFEPASRAQMIRLAAQEGLLLLSGSQLQGVGAPDHEDWAPLQSLPGLPTTWGLQREHSVPSSGEVLEVSRRLLLLQQLLGAGTGDCSPEPSDLAFMVTREPDLLTTDLRQLMQRLLDMRVATMGTGVDVVQCVVRQPALLLATTWEVDLWANMAASVAAGRDAGKHEPRGGNGCDEDAPEAQVDGVDAEQGSIAVDKSQALVRAWEHGVVADGDREWRKSLQELAVYVAKHGDASVGFRDGDDALLSRWASKQRADARDGCLPESRQQALANLGFEFDEDEAEWVRWFTMLRRLHAEAGHSSPGPFAQGVDLRLIHWCSVMRVARRSRVLHPSRVARLDALDFDWSGADPLS